MQMHNVNVMLIPTQGMHADGDETGGLYGHFVGKHVFFAR